MVSRPRPNYLAVCFGSLTTPTYHGSNDFGGFPICTAKPSAVKEHLKSFPSGHSSFAAAGLGFLGFFMMGLTKCFVGGHTIGRLSISLKPFILALLIGVSRVMDYWHHPTDVVAGLVLGFAIAYLFYRALYPSFFVPDCDIPSRNNSGASPRQEGSSPSEHNHSVINTRPLDSLPV